VSTEKTEALVIRLADFSETSRVATLFTRDFGKISALAKGGKRLKGPFEAALDLLTHCRIVFLRKSSTSLDLLTEAQVISRFRPQGRSLARLYGGYYVAELLTGLTEEYDPHPVLFDAAVRTLARLASDEPPRPAVLRFELATLREIGQLPAVDECLRCGQPTDTGGPFVFWVSQGGLLCASCRQREHNSVLIHPPTIAYFRRLADDDPVSAEAVAIPPQPQKELEHITTAAVSHVLGRRPKMIRYLTE
jgi:DNA repair protein RecO (recombination protein O)